MINNISAARAQAQHHKISWEGIMEILKDWLGTFWRILVSPSPATFVKEAEKAENKMASAIGWAVFISFYSYLLPLMKGPTFKFTILLYGVLIFPLVIILVPSATHFMLQRLFHRKQYLYDRLLYIFTAILVLFQLIVNPIGYFAPPAIASALSYILIAYQFVLFVIAVKAIAKIKYWQSVVSVFASIAAGALIFVCTLPFITSMMGGINRIMR
jgi:hypothetical protein